MKHTPKSVNKIYSTQESQNTGSHPSLQKTDGGFIVYYGKKPLYSTRDPQEGVSRRIRAHLPLKEKTLYIMASPLLYYGAEELLKNLPETSEIWGIELDYSLDIFCSEKIDPRLFKDSRLKRFPREYYGQLPRLLFQDNYDRFKNIELLKLSGGYSISKQLYAPWVNSLKESLKIYWNNRLTRIRLGKTWTKNLYRNLVKLKESRSLESFPVKEGFLVIGAGITVEKVLPLIKDLSSRLTIIAADTALPILKDYKIKPDGVVNLDAQFYNLYDFYSSKNSGIPLLSDLTAYPASLEITHGPNYLFYTDFGESSLLNRIEENSIPLKKLRPLGSVGLTCLEIVCQLSEEKPVFLAGLDFAFKIGKSHCKSSFYHSLQLQSWSRLSGEPHFSFSRERPLQPVTKEKSHWITDRILAGYAENMKHQIALASNPVYSITPQISPLGISCIQEKREIFNILDKGKGQKKAVQNKPVERSSESQKRLIEGEKKLLLQVIQLWDSYSQDKSNEEELKEVLKELKDLYAHSPMEYPHPRMEATFLIPAMDLARRILRFITPY